MFHILSEEYSSKSQVSPPPTFFLSSRASTLCPRGGISWGRRKDNRFRHSCLLPLPFPLLGEGLLPKSLRGGGKGALKVYIEAFLSECKKMDFHSITQGLSRAKDKVCTEVSM
ncbi:hypothetical protein NPIL_547911 [Nephila pilipes]|uniref:Uncharacterized protein n=1 Tax=Nephila pilipes TaxID=299642 RepID=A0A8X6PW38_NEPPI|nr:hypothetical protein NPIL_547911 [Nephila pilipes]